MLLDWAPILVLTGIMVFFLLIRMFIIMCNCLITSSAEIGFGLHLDYPNENESGRTYFDQMNCSTVHFRGAKTQKLNYQQ